MCPPANCSERELYPEEESSKETSESLLFFGATSSSSSSRPFLVRMIFLMVVKVSDLLLSCPSSVTD